MKKLIFAFGLLSVCVLSCTTDAIDKNSLNGSWVVYSFEDLATGVVELKTQQNSWNKDIKITFEDALNPKAISGINISNQFFGEFSYVSQNGFRVSKLGSTEVNQPRWADQFMSAILDPSLTFEVGQDNLIIYYRKKSKRVRLKKE
jgi:hypothetical protein